MSEELCAEVRDGLLGDDPVGFLRRNIVFINFDKITGLPGQAIRTFDVTTVDLALRDAEGATIPGGKIYDLDLDMGGTLQAHYLPWGEDAGYCILLSAGHGVRLMFTAALNGCAVGYVRAPDGSARVSHRNIQAPGGVTDDDAQRQSLSFATNSLQRNDYLTWGESTTRSYRGKAHVHGVRGTDGRWRFYAQRIQHHRLTVGAQELWIIDAGKL